MTEAAPGTVARLGDVFADVRTHDLTRDPPVPEADLHLLHRIDTELDDVQFHALFRRFAHVSVLLAVSELLSPRALVRETLMALRPGSVRAGRVRSRGAFEAAFESTHRARRLDVGDLDAWLLEPR